MWCIVDTTSANIETIHLRFCSPPVTVVARSSAKDLFVIAVTDGPSAPSFGETNCSIHCQIYAQNGQGGGMPGMGGMGGFPGGGMGGFPGGMGGFPGGMGGFPGGMGGFGGEEGGDEGGNGGQGPTVDEVD